MATSNIDAVLSLRDNFTKNLNKATEEFSRAGKTITGVGRKFTSAGKTMTKVGGSLTKSVTLPIAGLSAVSVKLATDAQKTEARIKTVFGNSTKTINDFAKNSIDKFGISAEAAKTMASSYGALSTGVGISTKSSAKMSIQLTKLASDMASFYNKKPEETAAALNGIFTGQTRGLKKLGVVMSSTSLKQFAMSKGYKTQYSDMTAAQQAQVRYQYVLEHTKKVQGDYAKHQNSVANQSRKLKGTLQDLGVEFGTMLLPVMQKAIKFINKILDHLNKMSPAQKKMLLDFALAAAAVGPVITIFGKLSLGIGSLIKGIGGVATAVSKGSSLLGALATTGGFWVVIAIAAVAVIVLIITHWKQIKKFFAPAIKHIKELIKWFEDFGKKVKEVFGTIGTIIGKGWSKFKGFFSKVGGGFKSLGSKIGGWFSDKFYKAMTGAAKMSEYLSKHCANSTHGIKGVFGGLNNFITGVFTGNWSKAWKGVTQIFKTIFNGLVAIAKAPLNGIIWLINKCIDGLNHLHIKVPKWVPHFGGKTFGFNISHIPKLAKGTSSWQGGLAQINERGGEIVDLPKGSRVIPHDLSKKMVSQSKKIVISKLADTIVVRKESDIDTITKKLVEKLEREKENVSFSY